MLYTYSSSVSNLGLSYSPGGLAVGIIIILLVIVAIVAIVIFAVYWYRWGWMLVHIVFSYWLCLLNIPLVMEHTVQYDNTYVSGDVSWLTCNIFSFAIEPDITSLSLRVWGPWTEVKNCKVWPLSKILNLWSPMVSLLACVTLHCTLHSWILTWNPWLFFIPVAGTLKPIPISEFGTHVKRMHANDDYLFSEEYTVSELFSACDLQRMVLLHWFVPIHLLCIPHCNGIGAVAVVAALAAQFSAWH